LSLKQDGIVNNNLATGKVVHLAQH